MRSGDHEDGRLKVPNVITKNTLFVLGAGVDVALGLPTMDNLMGELARFSREEGKTIDHAIRSHVKGIRFNLQKRAGEQGEQFGEFLLSSHSHLIPEIKNALKKYENGDNDKIQAMLAVVEQIENIRKYNQIDDKTLKSLAEIAGDSVVESGGDYLINPRGLTLTAAPREAIRKMFQGALHKIEGLTDSERQALKAVVAIVSNFEEILGEFFSGFFTRNLSNQKRYFYLSWLLWAYLLCKQIENKEKVEKSFYKTLKDIDNHNVISFNYTRFFMTDDYSKIAHFHGECGGYIRFDNREYIDRDDRIENASSIEDIRNFLSEMEINWGADPAEILLPGIVPPLSVKPIICNEYLDKWAEAAKRIEQADRIIIVGYSFNVADEHFNDLIRKRNNSADIILINPNIEMVKPLVSRVLALDYTNFTKTPVGGINRWKYGRVALFEAKAEEVTAKKLQEILR